MASEWKDRVEKRERELTDLYTRLDNDKDLYFVDTFFLKDSLGKKIPQVYNMVLPDARLFADEVIAKVRQAEQISNIRIQDADDRLNSDVERMLRIYYAINDLDLNSLGYRGGLMGTAASSAPMRGGVVWKSMPYVDSEGKLHPSVIPWDRRFFAWEYGSKGYDWVSYRTKKSPAMVKAEYAEYEIEVEEDTDSLEIITPEEVILVLGEEEKKKPHPWLEVPVVDEYNDTSAFFRDDGYLEYEGEGIFAPVRDLYDELFRVASVLLTHTMRSFQHNYQLLSEDAKGARVNFNPSPFGERSIIPMKKGERLEALTPDNLQQTILYLLNLIQSSLQRGTLPPTTYGSTSQPMSAVAIKTLNEGESNIIDPLLNTLSRARKRMDDLILRQWVIGNFKDDRIEAVKPSVIEKPREIEVKMYYISPLANIANWQMGEMAAPFMGKLNILDKVIHDPNPKETYQTLLMQEAEMLSEELMIWNRAEALYQNGEDYQAAVLLAKIGLNLDAMTNPNPEQVTGMAGQQALSPGKASPPNMIRGLLNPGKTNPGEPSSYEESNTMRKQMEVNQ